MARNFYVVLGVSDDADPSEIRGAYRRLAKQLHPDTGAESVERFTEVQEAYETLSDTVSRRRYDDELRARGQRSGRPGKAVPPAEGARAPRPRGPAQGRAGAHVPGRPYVDDSTGLFTASRHAWPRDLFLEIVLTPAEAARGGLFPLEMPVRELCPHCRGVGLRGMAVCRTCAGAGALSGKRALEISIPEGVADGTRATLALDHLGVANAALNVLVSVR